MDSKEVIISAVGDISLGDYNFCIGYGVGSIINKYASDHIFENVKSYFESSDIVFGNLETVLSFYGCNSKKLSSIEMRGNPKSIEGLKKCYFNLLNIANNHSLQHGEAAFFETVNLLESNNISVIGVADKKHWHSKPVVVKKNGIKFGFLGYAFETDKYFKGKSKYAFGKPEYIKQDIAKLRTEVDYVLVSCHWGLEFMDYPSISTVKMARELIDEGVDVILGHHPHVLQGFERYNNGIIFYSLGNFVFDMHWDQRFKQSMIVKLIFEKAQPINFKIIPIVINSLYQPEIVNDQENIKYKKLLDGLSKKIYTELDGDTEFNSYKYYLEYEKLRKRNRYLSYLYFVKNILHSNIQMLFQIIVRTFFRKIDDLVNIYKRIKGSLS